MTTVASKGKTISHIHEKRNSVEYFLAWCEVLTDIYIENQKSPKRNNKSYMSDIIPFPGAFISSNSFYNTYIYRQFYKFDLNLI